jgi:hypothetical protein
MNSIFRRPLLLCFALAFAACQGPTGLLPGESLEALGKAAAAPTDWDFAGEAGGIKLETNPVDPYSVNLAYTVMDGRLYINAGGTETQWAKYIAADGRVRLLLDGQLYDLRAQRVTDQTEIESFAEAWTGQSFFRRDPRKYEEIWLFELAAR